MKLMRFSKAALLCGLLAGLSACNDDGEGGMCVARPAPNFATAPSDPCDSFSSTFTLKDSVGNPATSFAQGAPVTLELKVTNNAATAKSLTVGGSCDQKIEVDADHPACLVYSTSPPNTACTQIVGQDSYAAGESKTFSTQWTQTDYRTSRQVGSGAYTAYGIKGSQCAAKFYSAVGLTIR